MRPYPAPAFVTALAALVLVSACAAPRDTCISQATRDYRQANWLIGQAEANIARGFAYERVQDTRVRRDRCEGETSDGVEFEFDCERTEVMNRQVPVAIDLDAERARLASIREQLPALAERTQARVDACVAAHPQ